ncbi:MAG TPA: hypothetical protein VMU09_12480 [Acidimicrobiales bacterium]|nr:hypothetical protein [Acidimicrobiales bacterium]
MPAAIELAEGVWRIPTLGDSLNTFAFVDTDGTVTLLDAGPSSTSRPACSSPGIGS